MTKTKKAMRARRTPKVIRRDSPTASTSQPTRNTKSDRQVPRITYSPMTKSWYVVTAFTMKRGVSVMGVDVGKDATYLVAKTKFDVTDQMNAILTADRERVADAMWRTKAATS